MEEHCLFADVHSHLIDVVINFDISSVSEITSYIAMMTTT